MATIITFPAANQSTRSPLVADSGDLAKPVAGFRTVGEIANQIVRGLAADRAGDAA